MKRFSTYQKNNVMFAKSELAQTTRVSIPHISKMKPEEFVDLCVYFKDELKGIISAEHADVSEKVDGFGIRFGVDGNGRFFIESSNSGPKFNVGEFSQYEIERFGAARSIGKGYDDVLDRLSKKANLVKYLRTVPGGVKVIGECLYNPNATVTDLGLKFLATTYDAAKLGAWATFILFDVLPVDPAQTIDKQEFLKGLFELSDSNVKFTDASLTIDDIHVDFVVNDFFDILSQFPKWRELLRSRDKGDAATKSALMDIFSKFQEKVSQAISDGLKTGKFGPEMEGVVFALKSGKKFKVVTSQYKANKQVFNAEFRGQK